MTNEQKAEARLLRQCAYLSIMPHPNGSFIVWGGAGQHRVTVRSDGSVYCDCKGWPRARNHVCSHVYKWKIVYGDLKRG